MCFIDYLIVILSGHKTTADDTRVKRRLLSVRGSQNDHSQIIQIAEPNERVARKMRDPLIAEVAATKRNTAITARIGDDSIADDGDDGR